MTSARRILVLTFYYPPDVTPGSFRAEAFVRALRSAAGDVAAIEVIAAAPNRYSTYAAEASAEETDGPVRIRRVAVPRHQSGIADQIRTFAVFATRVLKAVRRERYDLVFATSSRLFTAVLGAVVAQGKGTALFLDIRDIFVETILGVLPRWQGRLAQPVLEAIERATIRRADSVNLVSPGFEPYFAERYPGRAFACIPNGVDDAFLEADFACYDSVEDAGGRTLRVVYAGNVGHGQGLHQILPELARRLGDRAHFQIVGDGGARGLLRARLAEEGADNVTLDDPVPRQHILELYAQADVLFLHLNTDAAFLRVLPSKLFEYAATGKPILAGVSGQAADFLAREAGNNIALFAPCDPEGAERAFATLRLGQTDRGRFVERYRRTALMADLARRVLATKR